MFHVSSKWQERADDTLLNFTCHLPPNHFKGAACAKNVLLFPPFYFALAVFFLLYSLAQCQIKKNERASERAPHFSHTLRSCVFFRCGSNSTHLLPKVHLLYRCAPFVRSFFSFCSSPRTTKNTLITPSLLLPASFFSPFSRQSWKPDTHSHSPAHNGPSHLHCSSLKQWQANWLKDCMCA